MQLTGYINTTTPIPEKYTNNEGHKVIKTTYVPRPLEELDSEVWLNQEFLVKMLDPRCSKKWKTLRGGIKSRDLYFGAVHTKKYKYMKWGKICSKVSIDPDTDEPTTEYWIWVGGQQYRLTPSQMAQIAPLSDSEAATVSEDVANV